MTIEPTPEKQPENPDKEPQRKLFHATYNVPCRRDGIPEIHQTRDSGAFNDLRGPIEKLGFEWETEMMLYGYRGEEFADPLRNDPSEFVLIEKDDCLALTTRPPISDLSKKLRGRSWYDPSKSYPEQGIFAALSPFMTVCSRKIIQLNPAFLARYQRKTKSDELLFSEMTFGQHNDARIQSVQVLGMEKPTHFNFDGSGYTTMAFFLNQPSMPGIGCQLFAAWGQGGKETAAWCRILRKQFPHWFNEPRFAVVEISFDHVPLYPLTLHYADHARVRVHLDHVIDDTDDEEPARLIKKSA